MKPGDLIGDEWRYAAIGVAVACTAIIIAIWAVKRRRGRVPFYEGMALWGGAMVCAAVGLASLGTLLHWDPVWRLPFLVAALVYVLIGRGIELRRLTRKK